MATIRNAVLLGASAFVLCAAMASVVAGYASRALSGSEGNGYSYLEGREFSGLPPRTVEAFASGEFQDGFETFMSDALPGRGRAMLINARLQGLSTTQMAALFGYDAVPTYFSSERLYVPSVDAVTYLPHQNDAYYGQKLGEFAGMLADAARRHPEKRFVVYVVQGYQEPGANPAYSLMSNPYLPGYAVEALAGGLAGSPNVSVLTDSYGSAEEYYRDFFRSDHHWNILGALRGYNTIAAELGLEPVDLDAVTLHEVREGYRFSGATSRWGRCIVEEPAYDADIDYSDVTYEAWGSVLDGNDHVAFESYDPAGVQYAFYDAYYNAVPDGPISGPGTGKAVLVSNSYGGAVQRQLAMQYQTLYKSVALWPGYTGEDLEGLLAASDADTVIFVANPTDYMNMVDNLPEFFS